LDGGDKTQKIDKQQIREQRAEAEIKKKKSFGEIKK